MTKPTLTLETIDPTHLIVIERLVNDRINKVAPSKGKSQAEKVTALKGVTYSKLKDASAFDAHVEKAMSSILKTFPETKPLIRKVFDMAIKDRIEWASSDNKAEAASI